MRLLNEWTQELDQDPPDPLEMAKYEGYVRNRITDLNELTEKELAWY